MKETELYKPIKKMLEKNFKGIELHNELGNVDITAFFLDKTIAIEMKTSLNTKVLEQAFNNLSRFQYSYIAVPFKKPYGYISIVYEEFIEKYGIGVIYIKDEDYYQLSRVDNKKNIPRNAYIYREAKKTKATFTKEKFLEYHKDEIGLNKEAGHKSGYCNTPYSVMIEALKEIFNNNANKWLTTSEMLDLGLKTHYRNPKPSLSATLRETWNKKVFESKKEGRTVYFRLRQR